MADLFAHLMIQSYCTSEMIRTGQEFSGPSNIAAKPESPYVLAGTPDVERKLSAIINLMTLEQLGAAMAALLLDAEQQVTTLLRFEVQLKAEALLKMI